MAVNPEKQDLNKSKDAKHLDHLWQKAQGIRMQIELKLQQTDAQSDSQSLPKFLADQKQDATQFTNEVSKIVGELKEITDLLHASQVQSQTVLPTNNYPHNSLLITAYRGDKLDEAFERQGERSPSQLELLSHLEELRKLPDHEVKSIGDLSEQELASIGRQIMQKKSKAYNKRID